MIAKTANVQKYCGLNKDDLMNPNALRMVVLRAMRENLSYSENSHFAPSLEAFLRAPIHQGVFPGISVYFYTRFIYQTRTQNQNHLLKT